jgi:hypothetical protein
MIEIDTMNNDTILPITYSILIPVFVLATMCGEGGDTVSINMCPATILANNRNGRLASLTTKEITSIDIRNGDDTNGTIVG